MANDLLAKVYYENTLTPAVVTFGGTEYTGTWQYDGPGKAVNSSGGSFSNVYILYKDNWLYYEKRKTQSQANNTYDIRGSVNVVSTTTYTDLGIIIGYLDWVVSPVVASKTYLEKTTGISIGFTTDLYPIEIRVQYTFVLGATTITNTQTYSNTKSVFSVNLFENSTAVSLFNQGFVLKEARCWFRQWNNTGRPAVTFIAPYLIKDYTFDNGLVGFRKSLEAATDNNLPKFGIIPGYGDITLYDKDKEILQFADWGALKSRLKVKLYIEESFTGQFVTDDFNYEESTKEIKFNLIDDLLDLQGITFNGTYALTTRTLDNFYLNIFRGTSVTGGPTPTTFPPRIISPLFYFTSRTSTLSGLMAATSLKYSYIQSGTMWELANKFLTACGAIMFKSPEEYVSSTSGHIIKQTLQLAELNEPIGSVIAIPASRILEGPRKSIVNKNYINGVSYKDRVIVNTGPGVIDQEVYKLFDFKTSSSIQASTTDIYNFSFLNSLFSYGFGTPDYSGFDFNIEPFSSQQQTLPSKTQFNPWPLIAGDVYSYTNLASPELGRNATSFYYATNPVFVLPTNLFLASDVPGFTYSISWKKWSATAPSGLFNRTLATELPTVYTGTTSAPQLQSDGRIRFSYSNGVTQDRVLIQLRATQDYGGTGSPINVLPPVNQIVYIPEITLKVEGDVFKEQELPKLLGEQRNVYELETNEIMNTDAIYNGTQTLTDRLTTTLLSQYQNGRETAQLTCLNLSDNNPYYVNGTSTFINLGNLGRTFLPGRPVAPKVFRNGVEVPLSKKPNGTEKTFIITSAEFEHYGNPIVRLKMIESK